MPTTRAEHVLRNKLKYFISFFPHFILFHGIRFMFSRECFVFCRVKWSGIHGGKAKAHIRLTGTRMLNMSPNERQSFTFFTSHSEPAFDASNNYKRMKREKKTQPWNHCTGFAECEMPKSLKNGKLNGELLVFGTLVLRRAIWLCDVCAHNLFNVRP